LKKKLASLLPTSVPHPAGFLRQGERYQVTRKWWTPYVIRWNIRGKAIHSQGTCIFFEKIDQIFLHISPFFMEKNPV
jgi:hypothetical protein